VTGGAATFAPNFAVETTPIENWLEIEAGVSPFYTRNATEWDTDLLFIFGGTSPILRHVASNSSSLNRRLIRSAYV
jgi:hypothetical protein